MRQKKWVENDEQAQRPALSWIETKPIKMTTMEEHLWSAREDSSDGVHREVWGPLRHLYTNVPYIPAGPVSYGNHRVEVRIGTRKARVFVVHGIWCTHLGPICDALGIDRPPPADLAKRKISQTDLRLFVEASRKILRAGAFLFMGALAARAVAVASGLHAGARPL